MEGAGIEGFFEFEPGVHLFIHFADDDFADDGVHDILELGFVFKPGCIQRLADHKDLFAVLVGVLDAAVEGFFVELSADGVAASRDFVQDGSVVEPPRFGKADGFAAGLFGGGLAGEVADEDGFAGVEDGLGETGEGVEFFGQDGIVVLVAVVLAEGANFVEAVAVETGDDHGVHGVVEVGVAGFFLADVLDAPSVASPGDGRAVDGIGFGIGGAQESDGVAGDDASVHELAVEKPLGQLVRVRGEGAEFFAPVV